MIRHWTEGGMELFALYRERENPDRYVACQFEPFPTFHDVLTGEIVEYESNDEVVAVDDSVRLPTDVEAGMVQFFSYVRTTGGDTDQSRVRDTFGGLRWSFVGTIGSGGSQTTHGGVHGSADGSAKGS